MKVLLPVRISCITIAAAYQCSTDDQSSLLMKPLYAEGQASDLSVAGDVTFLTAYWPNSDLIPLDLMLPHQLAAMSRESTTFRRIVVVEPTGAESANIGEKLTYDAAIHLKSQTLLGKFIRGNRVRNLKDLWCEEIGCLEEIAKVASNTAVMLLALDSCRTEYCAWMDPDIFLYRQADAEGWVDAAIRSFRADPALAVIQAPTLEEGKSVRCRVESVYRSMLSSRHFIVRKETLQAYLPVTVTCAPHCNYFEAFFFPLLPQNATAALNCGETSWAVHPPDERSNFIEILKDCAASPDVRNDLIDPSNNSNIKARSRLVQEAVPRLWEHIRSLGIGLSTRPSSDVRLFKTDFDTMKVSPNSEWGCHRSVDGSD